MGLGCRFDVLNTPPLTRPTRLVGTDDLRILGSISGKALFELCPFEASIFVPFKHAPARFYPHPTSTMAALTVSAPIVAKVAAVSTVTARKANAMMVWQPHGNK